MPSSRPHTYLRRSQYKCNLASITLLLYQIHNKSPNVNNFNFNDLPSTFLLYQLEIEKNSDAKSTYYRILLLYQRDKERTNYIHNIYACLERYILKLKEQVVCVGVNVNVKHK